MEQTKIAALDGRWHTALKMVETALICPNPYHELEDISNTRLDTLVDGIQAHGVTSPLTVRAIGTPTAPLFQLISEEERLRACILANLESVPCVIIDADHSELPYLEQISLPRNYFEECDLVYELVSKNTVSESEMAKYFGISIDTLQQRLCLHEFDKTERKLILRAKISAEHAIRLWSLDPRTKCEVYRAMVNGVHGRSAEDLIYYLSESKVQTRIYIKNSGLFYNSIDKAIATMNRSGISVKCAREERKTFTRLTITVPKRAPYTS